MHNSNYWKDNDKYHARQGEVGSVEANVALFVDVFEAMDVMETVTEFGAGEGRNIEAINMVDEDLTTTAIELNAAAAEKIPADNVLCLDMLEDGIHLLSKSDLTFTKGVLIHIPPKDIDKAYDALYNTSKRYILVAEYYNPVPQGVTYDGRTDLLWKRDFAGEMMDKYKDLKLVDYGFIYHRDEFPQDDLTWFLMEKISE